MKRLCRFAAAAALLCAAWPAHADPDVTPPSITGVNVLSDWTIELLFSEQLSPVPAEDRSNFTVRSGDYSTIEVEFAEYLPSSRSVALSLKYPLKQKSSYRVTARMMKDTAGNVRESDSADFLPIDRTPPWLKSAVSLDSLHVAVLFDEPLDASSASEESCYAVLPAEEPASPIAVAEAAVLTPVKVWLTLRSPMRQPAGYSLRVAGVKDLAGIAIPPEGFTTAVRFPDDRPPYVQSVRQELCSVPPRLEILFNEPLDSCYALDPSCYAVLRDDGTGTGEPLAEWIGVGDGCERVYLGLAAALEPGTGYTLCLSGIRDLSGNPVPEGYFFDFKTPAGPAPVYEWEYEAIENAVEISWTLAPQSLAPRFTVLRAEGGSGGLVEPPGSALHINGPEYRFVDDSVVHGRTYIYQVEYTLGDTVAVLFTTKALSVPGAALLLAQNYPNPFNPATSFSWYQPGEGAVVIEVYDVSGRRVALVERGDYGEGGHTIEWDGTGDGGEMLGSGVYFYRISWNGESRSRKMVLLR